MGRDPKYDILFEPIQIGPKTARNRFYQTPHATGMGTQYPAQQAYNRGIRAEGGWGVVNTEYCSIHPESDDTPWIGARLWDEGDVRNLAAMCDKVHEHGSLAGVELHFGGANYSGYEGRLAARGVSQIPSKAFWMRSCSAMDKEEIRELQGFYVAAAKRAVSAGFDLVIVYGAEASPIPLQFLMPYFNRRTDEYGGSFENRARFYKETIELVREAVGDDCGIVVRFSVDNLRDDDLGIRVEEDGTRFVEHVDHLVDLWDLQVGGPTLSEWLVAVGASSFRQENWQRDWIAQVRPHTTKPIVGVGRFTNPDTMVAALRSGQLDMIGGARPSIADPFLPAKIEDGRIADIRECIGCNICGGRVNQGGAPVVCTQNATFLEEYRRGWHPEKFSRASNSDNDVLVIGAGPAGMECAVVLGKRGMRRVHLVDAESELGGNMRWITKLPGRGEWSRVVNYRKIQIDQLPNVEFIPGKRLDAEDVAEYGAEIVIVATGSYWDGDGTNVSSRLPIDGANPQAGNVFTPEQIMAEEQDVPGPRVVIFDSDGYFMAAGLGEKLAREGHAVTIVSPFHDMFPYLSFTGEAGHFRGTLESLGVTLIAGHVLTEIHLDGVALGGSDGRTASITSVEAECVVLVTQRQSDDQLYRELKRNREALAREGVVGVYRIGDCVAPRLITDCVFDGHRLAREIDSSDPAVPLPYIREHRIMGASDEYYDAILGNGPAIA